MVSFEMHTLVYDEGWFKYTTHVTMDGIEIEYQTDEPEPVGWDELNEIVNEIIDEGIVT